MDFAKEPRIIYALSIVLLSVTELFVVSRSLIKDLLVLVLEENDNCKLKNSDRLDSLWNSS